MGILIMKCTSKVFRNWALKYSITGAWNWRALSENIGYPLLIYFSVQFLGYFECVFNKICNIKVSNTKYLTISPSSLNPTSKIYSIVFLQIPLQNPKWSIADSNNLQTCYVNPCNRLLSTFQVYGLPKLWH